MANGDVDWPNHIVGWGAGIIAATATLFGGAYVRLFRHEERIKALEEHHANKIRAIDALAEKVDANHASTTDRIDALGEAIRADLRIIMSRCLSIGHDGK